MSRMAQIIWKSIGVGVMAIIMIAAVVWGYKMRPTDTPCSALTFIIEDRADRLYVTETELIQVLRTEELYPVGQTINSLSLYRIEQAIQRHPMVRKAECYLTPRNEVRVRLRQRVPLLRVIKPEETFFIDTDRKAMPVRAAVKDSVLVVTGTVGVQFASRDLANFAVWLQHNTYWRKRIHHVSVQSPQMIYLYMQDNQPRIVLGRMSGYEKKLAKMRTFQENSAEAIQDKQYKEYDIRFHGQVIGRY